MLKKILEPTSVFFVLNQISQPYLKDIWLLVGEPSVSEIHFKTQAWQEELNSAEIFEYSNIFCVVGYHQRLLKETFLIFIALLFLY